MSKRSTVNRLGVTGYRRALVVVFSAIVGLAGLGDSFPISTSLQTRPNLRHASTRLFSSQKLGNATTISQAEEAEHLHAPSSHTAFGLPIGDDVEVGESSVVEVPEDSLFEKVLSSYLGPRVLLGVLAAVYATNFPLGALMNDNLPASAATSARMLVAAAALSPAIFHLKPHLRVPAVTCGFFTAAGYVTQSLALIDTDPAKVSFLGSATVLWCPLLEWLVDKKPMGLRESPQTWLAALLCLAGVGVLELYDPSDAPGLIDLTINTGDILALLQAIGFGTGVFWTSKMVNKDPDQALPVTATLIATTAFLSMLWCFADGWMSQPDWQRLAIPGMFLDPSLQAVAGAVLWTGLISTSLNFFVELTALGRVSPSEACVILASEPLWAALFAALFYHTGLTVADSIGGILIVAACLVNAMVKPSFFGVGNSEEEA